MADPDKISAIRQKAGARRPPPEIPPVTAAAAMGKALARAGDATAGLVIKATDVTEDRVTLSAVEQQITGNDLIAVVEGADSRFGLVIGDPNLIAAVIEMQTIGRVLSTPAPGRAPTRTDAAMCADFVDFVLDEFEDALTAAHLPIAELCHGFRFAVQLDDYRAVTMALPDTAYRRFQAALDLGAGSKQGTLTLLLPYAVTQGCGGGDKTADKTNEVAPPLVILGARVDLHAVLHRVRMPLDEVTGLAPGMTVSLSRDVLGAVGLEDMTGHVRATCRLGQAAGQRALRIGGEPTAQDVDFSAQGPAKDTTKGREHERSDHKGPSNSLPSGAGVADTDVTGSTPTADGPVH